MRQTYENAVDRDLMAAQPTGKRVAVTNGLPLLTYVEDGFNPIERAWLEDVEYEKVLRSKILANTDVVLINSSRRTFYLAWRRALPMTGWFWMGGNTGDINQTLIDKIRGVIKRETKLDITAERLVLRAGDEYFWKDRSQEPKDVGCHMFGLTFSLEVTDDEVAQIELDPKEYDTGKLREFTREEMVQEGVFPNLIDLYDIIFPPPQPSSFGEITLVSDDDRRTISEFNGADFAAQLFTVKTSNLPLGKHAHAKKFEIFTVLEGGGRVLTCQVDTNGQQIGPTTEHELAAGSMVRIEAFTAHTFYLLPGTKMHCYASAAFDKTDFIQTPFLVA